ncbi:MAG TPA: A/G-specific adenine glycosylase [Thermoanaerobaculia bacterium]|nr:A/G-specific adenine glycosylase [Thermoanaerobaculia bacterium]
MQKTHPRRVARLIETWFARHQRPLPWRDGYDPYHVWVSEVMLQQTRMEVVVPYFLRFLERFPDVHALAAATDDEVTAAWSGLGYYRRARMLRDGARDVARHHAGIVPRTVEELLTIPGIGRYTAGAIASIAFERRAPIVDGNVARVVSRIFATDDDAWPLAEALVESASSPRALNQGLMELGALLCTPRNPSCLLCPARTECVAAKTGRVEEFPRAKPKKITRALRIPLFIVRDRRGRILMRREEGPLMTGMVHLPHGNALLFEALEAIAEDELGVVRHTVTNRKIEFVVSTASVAKTPRGYEWIAIEQLDSLPHPSYVRKALRLLR